MTSLSWAAVEGNLEVFEWLLMDFGHDDQELSRVSSTAISVHMLAVTSRSRSLAGLGSDSIGFRKQFDPTYLGLVTFAGRSILENTNPTTTTRFKIERGDLLNSTEDGSALHLLLPISQ